MKKYFFFIMGIVLFARSLKAQFVPSIRTLSIGDTIPNIYFPEIFNFGSSSLRLDELKAPITIMDLWGTWCTSCIQHFPGLDSLQKEFPDSLRILLVNNQYTTQDPRWKVEIFIEEFKKRKPDFELPVIFDTSQVLRYSFPVKFLPHYIWFNNDRVIIAMTGSEQVNAKTIADVLTGILPYPMKLDHYDLLPKH